MDDEIILNRLVYDVFESKLAFIRELIQNACDATRARMFLEIERAGDPLPALPSRASQEWRYKFPIRVRISERAERNTLANSDEVYTTVSVEDFGIGMDEDVITGYLLQVGRSYYTSEAFKRSAAFVPTSHFGTGFLSVLAASDFVLVESLRLAADAQPIALTLTGPRNYVLAERGTRTAPGTKITVRLRGHVRDDEIVSVVRHWCRRIEFPIEVEGRDGSVAAVTAETPEMFVFNIDDQSRPDGTSRLALKAFSVDRPGIDGELYVMAQVLGQGKEDWTQVAWYKYAYRLQYPSVPPAPDVPETEWFFHGMKTSSFFGGQSAHGIIERLDFRRASDRVSLGRGRFGEGSAAGRDWDVVSRWREILSTHLESTQLAVGRNRGRYIQRLIDNFEPLGTFWDCVPESIRLETRDGPTLQTGQDLISADDVIVVWEPYSLHAPDWEALYRSADQVRPLLHPGRFLMLVDALNLSQRFKKVIFEDRYVASVERRDRFLFVKWSAKRLAESPTPTWLDHYLAPAAFTHTDVFDLAIRLHPAGRSALPVTLMNTRHRLGEWACRLVEAIQRKETQVDRATLAGFFELVTRSIGTRDQSQVEAFATRWNDTLPNDLRIRSDSV